MAQWMVYLRVPPRLRQVPVIDLTTSDPMAEILAATEELTTLSRGVSFIDSTPLPAAPGAIQRHCTKVQQTKRKVPNAVNAETHQVEPANNLTFFEGGSLNVYIFSRMSRTDPIFLPPIVVDDGTPAAQPSTGEISAA